MSEYHKLKKIQIEPDNSIIQLTCNMHPVVFTRSTRLILVILIRVKNKRLRLGKFVGPNNMPQF